MTHTPGPWRVHTEHADRIIVNGCCVYQVGNLAVSGSYAPGVLGEPDHDDVRLMAAAPELYAACLALRASLADWIDIQDREDERNDDDKALAFADAAIAKAEGRE